MLNLIIIGVVYIILSIILSVIATYYNENYISNTAYKFSEVITTKRKTLVLYFSIFLIFSIICVFFYQKKQISPINLTQAMVLWDALLAISVVDYKIKKISNASLIFILLIRIIFIIVQTIAAPYNFRYIVFQSILGMFVGGFIILACLLISRGGVGAGDFKLFAVLGLYYGLSGIIQIMMYSLFFAAIYSIFMLITRKAKLKTTMAMAPFILCGLTLYLFFAAVME